MVFLSYLLIQRHLLYEHPWMDESNGLRVQVLLGDVMEENWGEKCIHFWLDSIHENCVFFRFNSLFSQLWHSHIISFNLPPIIEYRENVYWIWFSYLGQYLCSSFNIYLRSVVNIIIHPWFKGLQTLLLNLVL